MVNYLAYGIRLWLMLMTVKANNVTCRLGFFYQFHWEYFAVVPRENQLFKVKEILLLWSDAKRIFQIHQMIGTISFLYFFRNAEQL